jgi:hypothetical protein
VQHHLLDDSLERRANIEAAKEQRLDAHKQRWEQAKDRLAHRPEPAPAFDMMGGPPSRNLARDHDEMLRNWTAQRDQIVKDFDQRIADCKATRTEMLKGFGHANEVLEQRHSEDRRALVERQRESFERLVGKELDRSHDWVSDKFKQRSHDGHERDE